MHANAGPRPSFAFSTKRRSEEAQRHHHSTASTSLPSIGHLTRRSESHLSSTPAALARATTQQPGRTLVRSAHGPPSSYAAHHVLGSHYGTSSSSIKSLPLQSTPLSAAPSSTVSTPRPSLSQSEILDGGFQHGYNPSISRNSSISHRNGSLSSYLLLPQANHPEPAPVSCQNQTQKLNMKRLMSKPTAIALPERASSAMAFASTSGYRDDANSMDDYQDIKSNSLDILRRSRRRSRSVDIMMNYNRAMAGTSAAPSERDPSSPLPARPGSRSRSSDNRAVHSSAPQSESSLVSPSSPVTPAAIIALAWMESQRRAAVAAGSIAGGQPSSSSSTAVSMNGRITSTSSSSPTVRPISTRADDLAPSGSSHPQELTASVAMSDDDQRISFAAGSRSSAEPEDPFVTWALAEQQLKSDKTQENVKRGSGAGATVGATVKELSRRVLGLRDKSREKHKAASHSHSYTFTSTPPSSFSMGTALPPASAVGKLVSKAPLSAISRVSTHERSRSFPRATKTSSSPISPQLAHGHVSHSTLENGAALRTNGTVVLNDEETGSPAQMLPWSLPLPSNGDQDDPVMLQAHTPLVIPPHLSARSPNSDAMSPLPPTPRSHTPNTLKKRSRGNLRQKPSQSAISTPVPVGGDPTSPSNTVVSPAGGPDEGTSGSSGGKLRGLVRKLSNGGLKRSARSQSLHIASPGGDISPATTSAHGHGGRDFIPPVPRIPKEFELIVDTEAYLAERAKQLERNDSDGDSTAPHGTLTPQHAPSRKSSRCPSPVPLVQQRSRDPTPLISTVRIPRRADTEPTQSVTLHPESKSLTLAMPVPDSSRGTYMFPKRPKPMQELSSSQGSTSHSMSGTDHGHATFGYRSSSPSPSSSDMHYGRPPATSLDETRSSTSHHHDTVPSRSHGIGQAIVSPRELYRRGEDEAANIRSRQVKDVSTTRQHKVPRKPVIAIPSDQVRHADQADDVPPPTLSPELLPSLSAPPPRPPRRREVKSKSSLPSTPASAPALRPTHGPRQRSISSPVSPVLPTFLTSKAVNAIPLTKRVRSVSNEADAPSPSTSLEMALQDTQASVVRSKSRSSVKSRANTLPPLVLTPTLKADSIFSGISKDDDGKGVRGQSSMGTITRAKSLFGSKSTSTTPNTSSSYFVSPQSAGRRSSSTRTSTDHHNSPAEGDPPPVPFTSTAFTFKELSVTPSPRSKLMSEVEREEMWNELLVKSDLAGGTLNLVLDKKEGLLSDNASFISSQ